MKLKELLDIYNFRQITDDDHSDTSIIRIYPDEWNSCDYFEIGVYDFGENNILSSIIKEDIMDKQISSFRVNDQGYLSVYLLAPEKEEK